MSTLAEIEAAADSLPQPEKEELFEFLAARLGRSLPDAPPQREIRLIAKNLGIKPEIDMDKIGQLIDDYE